MDNHESTVEMKPLLSCDKCEFDCETDEALLEHKTKYHRAMDCSNCEFTSEEQTVLKDHKSDCYLSKRDTKDQKLDNKPPTLNENTMENNTEEVVVTEGTSNLPDCVAICSYCAKSFETIRDCEEHMLIHSEPESELSIYQCSFCKIDCLTSLELEWHL